MTDITGLPEALAMVDEVTIRFHVTRDTEALDALAEELAQRVQLARAARRAVAAH
jgi:hypothetical protein